MIRHLGALISLALLGSTAVQAQSYPARTITLVVTAAAGGVTDVVARAIGQKFAEAWGQQVVIENKGGAAHVVGAQSVAKAAPDGYSLLVAEAGTFVINPTLYGKGKLPYDEDKDFAPITGIVRINQALLGHPSVPAKNVAELITLAMKESGKLTFASSGAGSSTHLSAELFKSLAGIEVVHVPFKGSGQALIDVVAGRVSMIFDNMPSALPHIKAGKLRALGVTSLKRSGVLPDVPTIAEAGLPGYESLSWSGFAVPAATPKEVVQRLNRETAAILATPDMKQKLAEQGADAVGGPPEAFAEHVRRERQKWGRLVRERQIVVN